MAQSILENVDVLFCNEINVLYCILYFILWAISIYLWLELHALFTDRLSF